jgi:hypothetical protein
MSTEDEQNRQPVPRAWREEFDGLRPIKPIVYRKPAPGTLDAAGEPERKVMDEKGKQTSRAEVRRP